MSETKVLIGSIISGLIGVIILVALFLSWYTVDQGERAIILRFGKILTVSDPGFHFKIPYMDTKETINVRTRKLSNKISIYSKDIQAAEIVLSLNYYINPNLVGEIYTQFGNTFEEKVIMPQIMAKPKDVFGKYNAVEIVQNREKLTREILEEFKTQFSKTGFEVESVQIENIDFSDEYEKTVEERMRAEVEVQKVKQNLEREKLNAEMVRTKAQGQADAKIAEAKATAESIKLVGQAEADAITVKSKALSDHPNYVKLIEAERWDGKLPSQMLPLGTVPIINMK